MDLVPLFSQVTGSETKLDLKAIYRRPGPGVTLTSPLPLRRHKDWEAKGFTYVSVSTLAELGQIAGVVRESGRDPLAMRSSFDRDGNFDVPQYLRQAKADDDTYRLELQAKVDKHGPEIVTELMRLSDPTFVLPAGIVSASPESKGKAK
jgi:hypothetical protein